jgi:hypothetical protein
MSVVTASTLHGDRSPAIDDPVRVRRSMFVTIALIILGFVILVVAIIAVHDLTQRQHAVTRNFPVIGHFRYFFEEMGQPLRQYFFAGDREERPYDRVTRSWVYASSKGQNNFIGFGSQVDHNEPGRMVIVPSMYPTLTPPGTTEADLPRPRGHRCETRSALRC